MLALQIGAVVCVAVIALPQAGRQAARRRIVAGALVLSFGVFSFATYEQHTREKSTLQSLQEARDAERRLCWSLPMQLAAFQGDVKGMKDEDGAEAEEPHRPFFATWLSLRVQGARELMSSVGAFCVRRAGRDVAEKVSGMAGGLGSAKTLQDLGQRLEQVQAMLEKYSLAGERP